MKHYFDGLCPNCRQRERQQGRTYCKECENERKRFSYRQKQFPSCGGFQTLLAEAQGCGSSIKYLQKMGEVGRVVEENE